jgi:hypothetical protein
MTQDCPSGLVQECAMYPGWPQPHPGRQHIDAAAASVDLGQSAPAPFVEAVLCCAAAPDRRVEPKLTIINDARGPSG